ncbi:cytochrome (ubi)quinol oxidase subunit III [Oceanobacillus profundus]|uniref:Cytochrome (Ubi)quinol oxidase subunit III n=1 Tax=Oceanobacillus profundus TaxID=372463 RepID=A0A417YKN7_9BACI|nr:cytochrome (ubi)quinol oxidase subunit III [Oceanobacillus profundus]MBR3119985.1 cytochrome (ubi)quinol oxidase subunit III [Oceanobacillus sp.]PAE30153.1 cytochrome (ubi)quinol oxidase subunit III [Paenibacillus sp. 7884-2]MCM3396221.1 cytochrome (ubi)quinol oxidase subunit III [Oceanobacillus profundus]MDO6449769.1 cytochrome (ubi)quinol oxidase subunit III [Oceanobacillus profundus]RHW33771.1 cytochrome (ubi)quinol oxidase subunit III [Oceanobacillus profundus]
MSHDHSLNPKTMPEDPSKATMEGKHKFLGLWFFLGGETVLFACFFGTYLALRNSTAGGPTSQDLFGLDLVFLMTVLLLTSSLTSVYAIYHMKNNDFKKMMLWLGITALLGIGFLACEIYEFAHYIHDYGFTFRSSAFGSAFYTLVGFHGGHVIFGLSWLITLMVRNAKRGLNLYNAPKFNTFALYWHFIDVVWVFIFTVVYLMGMVS